MDYEIENRVHRNARRPRHTDLFTLGSVCVCVLFSFPAQVKSPVLPRKNQRISWSRKPPHVTLLWLDSAPFQWFGPISALLFLSLVGGALISNGVLQGGRSVDLDPGNSGTSRWTFFPSWTTFVDDTDFVTLVTYLLYQYQIDQSAQHFSWSHQLGNWICVSFDFFFNW